MPPIVRTGQHAHRFSQIEMLLRLSIWLFQRGIKTTFFCLFNFRLNTMFHISDWRSIFVFFHRFVRWKFGRIPSTKENKNAKRLNARIPLNFQANNDGSKVECFASIFLSGTLKVRAIVVISHSK